mmetsp:Transcript_3641/g.7818  ORF Transcript_3641/g.7818 Transcript_3641/m.7818 type:complete len:538 (-) Transcript_3641:962-2575(-)
MKPWDNKPLFPIGDAEDSLDDEQRPTAADFFEIPDEPPMALDTLKKSKIDKKTKSKAAQKDEHHVYIKGVPYKLLNWKFEPYGNQENATYLAPDSREVPSYFRHYHHFLLGETEDRIASELISALNSRLGAKDKKQKLKKRYFEDRSTAHCIRILPKAQISDYDFIQLTPVQTVAASLTAEEQMLDKTREFSKLIAADPSNSDNWLDLVKFQDTVSMRKTQRLEKQLTILSKALETEELENPVPLILKYISLTEQKILAEYEGLSELQENELLSSQLNKVWKGFLEQFYTSGDLWTAYMTFCTANFNKFSVSNFREVHIQALLLVQQVSDEPEMINIAYQLVKIGAQVERQAGFSEKATAIYQALIEFNLRPPAHLAEHDKLRSFAHYWDSELPRVGETEGGYGWNFTDDSDFTLLEWNEDATVECILPSRTTSFRADSDPDSVIIFDDLQPYLLDFSSLPPEQLVADYLAFLGVSLPFISTTSLVDHLLIKNINATEVKVSAGFTWSLHGICKTQLEFIRRSLIAFTVNWTLDLPP